MKHGLLVAVIGLALVAGCGDEDAIRSSAARVPEECRAGWTEYPGPDDEDFQRCQKFFRDHPEIAARHLPTVRPAPTSFPSPEISPSDDPAAATAAAPRSSSGSTVPGRRPRPTAPAASGAVSASPAGTVQPEPSRSPAPSPTRTSSPTPASAPLLITEEDSGKTFEISRSTSDAVLRLGGGFYDWSQPALEGTSVRLQQRQFVRDPGYSEWEIQPVSSGTTVIRSTGDPKCRDAEPPCGAPSTLFEVRIVVR